MGEGIAALGPGVSTVEPPAQDVAAAAMTVEEARAKALRVLQPQIRMMLQAVPKSLAEKYRNDHLALSAEETENGVQVYTDAIEVLFPEIEKLTRLLAVVGVIVWTGSIAVTRIVMLRETKARLRAEADARARGEDNADEGSGGEAAGGGLPGDDAGTDPRFH
jgi:hypothetical protein